MAPRICGYWSQLPGVSVEANRRQIYRTGSQARPITCLHHSRRAKCRAVGEPSFNSFAIDRSALRCSAKIDHAAMNKAAIKGPMTKPLIPKREMPPTVEISTT